MWEFYDRIIDEIPDDLDECIDYIHVGEIWTVVSAGKYTGIAVTINEQGNELRNFDYLLGQPLKEVAGLCKSWDLMQASVGTAALNAYINSPGNPSARSHQIESNGFDDYRELAAGKKAGIVGHFWQLERFLSETKTYVLERKPGPGDYPDSACEYILPEMDFVFITGSAFINKTLPRLLQLSSYPIVLGPSTPMSPVLFDYGVREIDGFMPLTITKENAPSIGSGDVKFSKFGKKVKMV